ncbi:NosD domain-containing protein [Fulvivirgaceae bacterium BMA10]|uniref:NosD domain-containing protein n=1 Tax=Splendidivirga corallicola TaxID=3051826 RepID=A0ABT8KSZ5_9BACT|nr:NosD domain-containing protein [Fulvivirgaceae bacterium BMA10]
MKKNFILTTIVLLWVVVVSEATIIQVNNNPGTSADYSSLQEAIDNANTGDTIYVAGSPNAYDGTTLIRLNKGLVIIGPGYFLGENPNTQALNQTAKIYQMEIGESADNAIIMGLDFDVTGQITTKISNRRRDGTLGTAGPSGLTLFRNKLDNIRVSHGTNIIIEQNYILSGNSVHSIVIVDPASNILIQNNILITTWSTSHSINGSGDTFSNTIIRNNVMNMGIEDLNGVEIINNIFLDQGFFDDCDNNQIKNNVFTAPESVVIPTSSTGNTLLDNVFSVTQSEVFLIDAPVIDSEFQLGDSSPASGVGFEGVDAGAYGGAAPYVISGLPPIPSIYELTTNGIGSASEGINVRIKVRSNQ